MRHDRREAQDLLFPAEKGEFRGARHRKGSADVSSITASIPPSAELTQAPATHDVSVSDQLRAITSTIREKLVRLAGDYIAVGEDLLLVKSLVGHGAFGAYLKSEFDMSERTAERYMAAAERFSGKSDTVSKFPPTLVYRLSAKSTPESVVREVIARSEKGNPMLASEVENLLSSSRAKGVERTTRLPKADPMKQQEDALTPEHDLEIGGPASEAADFIRKLAGEQLPRLLDLLDRCVVEQVLADLRRTRP